MNTGSQDSFLFVFVFTLWLEVYIYLRSYLKLGELTVTPLVPVQHSASWTLQVNFAMKSIQKPNVSASVRLETLPAEIRNQIFKICIYNAMNTRKQIPGLPPRPSKPSSFGVSVFPRWSGPGLMRTDGIGPLPLLFVNKQIYTEVSSLVYSMLDSVSIGGYLIQRPDEDPNIRWEVAYSLLRKQPSLLKYTKKVKIFMPTVSHKKSFWLF
jgi:hypothetical protein